MPLPHGTLSLFSPLLNSQHGKHCLEFSLNYSLNFLYDFICTHENILSYFYLSVSKII